jgi:hypothetical protein
LSECSPPLPLIMPRKRRFSPREKGAHGGRSRVKIIDASYRRQFESGHSGGCRVQTFASITPRVGSQENRAYPVIGNRVRQGPVPAMRARPPRGPSAFSAAAAPERVIASVGASTLTADLLCSGDAGGEAVGRASPRGDAT